VVAVDGGKVPLVLREMSNVGHLENGVEWGSRVSGSKMEVGEKGF